MYNNTRQWNRIRTRILVHGESRRHVAKTEGMSRPTVRKILKYEHPPGYKSSARSKVKDHQANQACRSVFQQSKFFKDKQLWMEWLYALQQPHRSHSDAESLVGFNKIYDVLNPSPNSPRSKALVVLAKLEGFSTSQIAKHLGIARVTVRHYFSSFQKGGEDEVFKGKSKPRKSSDPRFEKMHFYIVT
jgi:transposase